MTSVYAVRLYEMLVQHLTIGKRQIEVVWLRTALCLNGEYPRIVDFKKWVVNVAVAQINEHSDIEVSYVQRKAGRAVTHLDFKIKHKEEDKPKAKKKMLSAGSDSRALPGETTYAFEKRMLEEKHGQKRVEI
jgi:plasmid replication initiation protein